MARPALLYLAIALLPLLAIARADEVKLFGKPLFRNVVVTAFEDGRLVFRGISGESIRKPLPQIEWVRSEAAPTLSAAETALQAGNGPAAVDKLRAARQSPIAWERELAELRLIQALDQTGDFVAAVRQFIQVARDKPLVAETLYPKNFGAFQSAENRLALRELLDARSAKPTGPTDAVLARLQLQISLIEDIDPLPHDLQPKPSGPARPATGRRLFGDAAPSPSAQGVTLGADAALFRVARAAARAGELVRAARLYERGLEFVDPADPGIEALRREQVAAAQQPPRQPANAGTNSAPPGDALLAARALYDVALAHERLNRPAHARAIYRGLAERDDLPPDLRALAFAGLARLGDSR